MLGCITAAAAYNLLLIFTPPCALSLPSANSIAAQHQHHEYRLVTLSHDHHHYPLEESRRIDCRRLDSRNGNQRALIGAVGPERQEGDKSGRLHRLLCRVENNAVFQESAWMPSSPPAVMGRQAFVRVERPLMPAIE